MKANTLTLTQSLELLKSKKISVSEIYADVSQAIKVLNRKLNIFLTLDAEAEKKAGLSAKLAFMGLPFAVKDNFLTVGMPTTASSKVLEGFIPPYESTVTSRLKKSGGVVIGKTNMDAWAHGSSTETSDYGRTLNPRNPAHLPGGSSGGSAAAVAADMCIAAIGSETAGSIRQPSAWCGTVGLKPTYGRVSRAGVVSMGSSLDSPGPIGKCVTDCALILSHIAGQDRYDATSAPDALPDLLRSSESGVRGMKIGVCYIDHPKLRGTVTEKAILNAADIFRKSGAAVTEIPISDKLSDNQVLNPDYAIGVYTVVQRSEVSSNLARYDGIRYGSGRSLMGDEAKRRIMLGTFTLSKGYADRYYVRAQQVRSLFINNFRQLFGRFDLLISPTSPGYALQVGATADNPMFGELEDMLLEPSSISGLPGISIPCHHDASTNLYLGLNIVANMWQEAKVIAAAMVFERETDFNPWLRNLK